MTRATYGGMVYRRVSTKPLLRLLECSFCQTLLVDPRFLVTQTTFTPRQHKVGARQKRITAVLKG